MLVERFIPSGPDSRDPFGRAIWIPKGFRLIQRKWENWNGNGKWLVDFVCKWVDGVRMSVLSIPGGKEG